MSIEQLTAVARETLSRAKGLGFDHLKVTAFRRRQLGVRLAQSTVCRENIQKDEDGLAVEGIWRGRTSGFVTPGLSADALLGMITQLRRDLERQSPDMELVLPESPPGRFRWEPTTETLDSLYGTDTLYPLVEKHAAQVRAKGRRLTGFIEASEVLENVGTLSGTELTTRDVGVTISITVDSGDATHVGTTQRAATHAGKDELARLIGEAVDEAMQISLASDAPAEMDPGDYTVVFHPAAALDLISTTMAYGLFDQRRVDENRTYLSKARGELKFPDGLRLAQTLKLALPSGGVYADMPLNHRLMPAESVELIGNGRIKDLHRSAYWAKETGMTETFTGGNGPPFVLEARPGTALAGKHKSLQDLIKDTPRGLFIANTWYLRMVAEMDGVITGMTRDGLFEIKDGKLVRPVKHMRWHDNPFRILSAITGLTDDKLLFGRARLAGRSRAPMALMPALRVENFHFSSVTRF